MSEPRRWRRLAIRGAAAVVLGVVTTVGVAWGLAFGDMSGDVRMSVTQVCEGEPAGRGRGVDVRAGKVVVDRWRRAGVCEAIGTAYGPGTLPFIGIPLVSAFAPDSSSAPTDLMPASMARDAAPWVMGLEPMPRGRDTDRRVVLASGWPLLALRSVTEQRPSDGDRLRWGVVAPWRATRVTGGAFGRASSVVLPLRPLWGGFVVNTIGAAGVWGVVLFAPGVMRRWGRRRRGACEGCGYDLRGAAVGGVCPECGGVARA